MFESLLLQREEEGNPIHVGIIGTGKFGGGLTVQIAGMKGMRVSAIADIRPERAREAYLNSGVSEDDLVHADSVRAIDDAIAAGRHVITEDGLLLADSSMLEVIVEATGVPEVGARMAYAALGGRKHVVMVNVETDVTIGAILRRQADSAGVVYTLVDGDQPGSTMNMVDWARALGFEIVGAGRGTIYYASDRGGLPKTVPERYGFTPEMIERRHINLKMFNSFRDGAKAQIEMTALANAAGLVPDVRGMHEPSVNLEDIPVKCSLVDEGGLLSQHGVVELANSIAADGVTMLPNPIRMGVFIVIRAEHQFQQEDLTEYGCYPSANGRNYLLYRPYHLVAVPAPMSIAKAALFGQATGSAMRAPSAEAITMAKRDLVPGDVLDGSGGYCVDVLCEKAVVAQRENLLPMGLSHGAVMKVAVPKGTAIAYDMVTLKEDSFIFKLRRLQDATVW